MIGTLHLWYLPFSYRCFQLEIPIDMLIGKLIAIAQNNDILDGFVRAYFIRSRNGKLLIVFLGWMAYSARLISGVNSIFIAGKASEIFYPLYFATGFQMKVVISFACQKTKCLKIHTANIFSLFAGE